MDQNGVTQRQHLLSAYRQTGIMPEALMFEPDPPDSMLYLWEDHLRIRRSLVNPMGITAMGFQELRSYQELYGVKHSSAEVDILIALDAIRIKQMNADKQRLTNGS